MFGFKVHHKKSWNVSDTTYNQIVGLDRSSVRGYLMQGQNCYLELYEYATPPSAEDPKKLGANDYGIRHLGFEVDDVRKEWRRLKELGGIHMNEPGVLDPDGGGAVYCRDPFGNIIELTNAGESTGYYPSVTEFQAGAERHGAHRE
jgi:catechol 2,3-dioxygenase-like lactoylglutathione lyase family enzyme